jgi:hypothetical protein
MEMHPETGVVKVPRIDGNVLAGPLSEIFRSDMTLAQGSCKSCQHHMLLADTVVEMDDAGFIVMCPSCHHVLFTVVKNESRTWIDLQGLGGLGIPNDLSGS